MSSGIFDDFLGGGGDFLPTCELCGESTLFKKGLVESKAGKVHALCVIDADKWRKWFARKAQKGQ
jgi:hypothetical protein